MSSILDLPQERKDHCLRILGLTEDEFRAAHAERVRENEAVQAVGGPVKAEQSTHWTKKVHSQIGGYIADLEDE